MTKLLTTTLILLCLSVPVLCDQFLLGGSEYLAQYAEYKAVPGSWLVIDSSNEKNYAGQVLDIKGRLSGTIGSGPGLAALVQTEKTSHAVAFGAAELPPLGSQIRVLARVMAKGSGSFSRLALIGWTFASDAERARTAAATAPSKPTTTYSSRAKGPTAARGSISHLQYFDAYRSSIKGINPGLTDDQVDSITRVLLKTSSDYDVDPRLIMAIVLAESGFRPSATSPKGAMGLGQLMPRTAQAMGLRDPYEPTQNLDACIKIIRSGLDKYSNKASWSELNWDHLKLALAAYNAGSGAVKKHGGVPPYRETQKYIAKVSAYYKQLCGAN